MNDTRQARRQVPPRERARIATVDTKRFLERHARECGASQSVSKRIAAEWQAIVTNGPVHLERVALQCGATLSVATRMAQTYVDPRHGR